MNDSFGRRTHTEEWCNLKLISFYKQQKYKKIKQKYTQVLKQLTMVLIQICFVPKILFLLFFLLL